MSLAVKLHHVITKYNILERPAEKMEDCLETYPTALKVALLMNHLFCAAAMFLVIGALPFSFGANLAISFGISLFFRLAIENNRHKFALPAFAGAVTYPMAKVGVDAIMANVAFSSFCMFAKTVGMMLPFTAYLTYIALTISFDVDLNYALARLVNRVIV